MDKEEHEKIDKEVSKIKRCSRCGNDFLKGRYCLHFPYEKKYVCLCHICLDGLVFSFYKDFMCQVKEAENG